MVPYGGKGASANAAVQRHWRMRSHLSRIADRGEEFLAGASLDKAPWLTVAFGAGIGSWFVLDRAESWVASIVLALWLAFHAAVAGWLRRRLTLRRAAISTALAFSLGMAIVWARSEISGAEPIPAPRFESIEARILEREERPAEARVRLVVAARDAGTGKAQLLRVNIPIDAAEDGLVEGAEVRFSARLMPPSPPILPGAYDFARAAWFKGYAATGSLAGDIEILEPAPRHGAAPIRELQRRLSAHVRERLGGSSGTIAAAFASGDRGGIAVEDEEAMRDAGLTHLLSISGLHVSAVIGAAYLIAIRLLALWPWLTLRVRLPLLAAGIAALAGIGYTLLTGAQVPTVRSCIGALLVLGALALGREPLSMRMVAVAAFCVLMLWPEALVGPSFQMSFAAVIAIVALHNAKPVREFLAPREESGSRRLGRRVAMLFVTGLVIEIALTPIVLYHFHRAGLYGAFANVLAIPLVTFISMPLIAVALLLDTAGLGGPVWWLVGKSLDLMLAIAHFTAAQPGSVKLVPHIGLGVLLLFVAGGLWLGLWRGMGRLLGLVPASVAAAALVATPVADVFVTRDAGNLAITGKDGSLHLLRLSEGSYAQTNLTELSATVAAPLPIQNYPGARCSADFCSIVLKGADRKWSLLVALSRERIDERQLAAACELSDIVIAGRWLPRSCKPRWLKIDRRYLAANGGTAIYLDSQRVDTVASHQGQHGWWRSARKPE